MSEKPRYVLPGVYALFYRGLVEIARERGYCLAPHGSFNRDLDLIAVPWIDGACSGEELIEALREGVGGTITPDGSEAGRWDPDRGEFVPVIVRQPEEKPHGRLAWNIQLGGGLFIDVSVMPRRSA